MTAGVRILTRRDVAALLDDDACIEAVERAFRRLGEGRAQRPAALGFPVAGGGFHVKAGLLDLDHPYFVAKVNGNFPDNEALHALPTIQGVLALADARNGRLLALMDSGEVTARRTAAASAVAARHLARADSRTATICGCGVQGRRHLEALARVLPLRRVHVHDRDSGRAARFAAAASAELDLVVTAAADLAAVARISDVVVTCTPSHEYVLGLDDVRPGVFVAAVGADHPDKREIEPALMRRARVVVDDFDQCAKSGDLHHAIAAGAIDADAVHDDLAAVVAGRAAGRLDDDEVTVFDSTGIALEDAAAAAVVHARAAAAGRGTLLALGD